MIFWSCLSTQDVIGRGIGGKTVPRYTFLDALRGLAALYVVLFHLVFVPMPRPVPPDWMAPFVHFGGAGVTLFFVISAFSLCLTMPRHISSGRPYFSFFVSRFFRIAPLFYFMIIASLVLQGLYSGVWRSPWKIFLSIAMIFNLIPGEQPGFVPAGWTIGVEVLFYAVFPVLFLALKTPAARVGAFLFACLIQYALPTIVSAVSPGTLELNKIFIQYTILRHIPVFLLGMVAFDAFQWVQRKKLGVDAGAILVALGLLGLTFIVARAPFSDFVIGNYYWRAIFFACLAVGLSLWPVRFVVNAATVFAGKLSYSIYLAHPPILLLLSPAFRRIYNLPITTTAQFIVSFALALVVVVSVAWLLFTFIEKPGINIGRKILHRPERGAPVSSAI
jgi:peptidoglycan/LPS O-acetylase OafA/YrhL